MSGRDAALCEHGFPAAACRAEYTPEQCADFDTAHTSAYRYALDAHLDRADAEQFAGQVAQDAAVSGLRYIDLRRALDEWHAVRPLR